MTTSNDYQGPLTGLNVIDFGHYYAGPMAGMLLADQGANVIRIVKLGGPTSREKELPEEQYRLLNRNKKLLKLDLKTEEGQRQVLSLIERADVVIENFRPGVMKRLGLDYASVKESNPGLVYLSLPGFVSTDKERAHLQAWEGVLGAAAGAYTQTSPIRQRLGFPPVYTPVPQCSTYGAVHGATAIMAALVAREKTGRGTVIEVPLVNAGASAVSLNFSALADVKLPGPSEKLVYRSGDSSSVQMEKLSEAMDGVVGLASKHYICADGRRLYVSTYLTRQFMDKFLNVLGIAKQVRQEGFVNVGPWAAGLGNDVGNTRALSEERRQRLTQLIKDAMLTRTASEWETLMAKVGLPAAVIRTREEYLALEPMHDSGVLTQLNNNVSSLTVPGRLADVSGPDDSLMGAYQEMESITSEQAVELFNPFKAKTSLPGAPVNKSELLKGLKVLDLCNVVAGPTSSHTLAEYGAEVIKMEAPDGVHPMFLPSALELNQGKRSILLDVKTAPGREIFQQLVLWADVVVHNCLDNTALRLGVSQEQLQRINPKIVSCQLTGNGGTWRKGWEQRPSFDNLIQGVTGLLAEYGSLEQPLWHGMISSADTIGGISMAFASLLAVYQQLTTGHAGEARTSLLRATNHYQLPLLIAENGHGRWRKSDGQLSVGEHAWQRLYACRDGWIYVGTREDQAPLLGKIVTGQSITDEPALEAAFAEQDCAWWLDQLGAGTIACHRVLTAEDMFSQAKVRLVTNEAEDETVQGPPEIVRWEDHPCGKPVARLEMEPATVGEHHSIRRLSPSPRYGQHTCEILRELGYRDDQIAELLRLKVAHEYLPGLGSKDSYFFSPNDINRK